MSLLSQLKRNLSNRSRKGKESHVQQRPETPNSSKYLDVDGDARSTYSVESDSKSFFSFSFENAESTSLCDFETTGSTTAHDGAKLNHKFSFEKSKAFGVSAAAERECSPPPYDVDKLEWILFYPGGVGKRFVGMLGINDVVALSQVCKAWRKWLVPEREAADYYHDLKIEKGENLPQWNLSPAEAGPRWHPLVQTVIAATPPSQRARDFIEPLGFYGRYHRQSIIHWQKYEFNVPRLLGVFGETYLSTISSLHLDGVALDTKSDWLRYCTNLESLSIRRCAGVTLDRLVDLLLGPESEESSGGTSSKKKKQKGSAAVQVPRPEKLRSLRFWGIDGARQLAYPHNSDQHISDRHRLEKWCERLMERFETDVSWCFGGEAVGHLSSRRRYRMLISMEERCGVCETARKDSGWEDGITCERCLGFNCRRCLKMKAISRDERMEDNEISSTPTVNMLELLCNQGGICGWEGGEHHVHPECIPPASLLWGHNDPLKHVFELYAHLQKM
ncbi:hypothetical protein TWF481_006411 [Arthrobotrys musiformis]|uniref:F-box domain-containing protein n=1 Tax=Arthrobotrys musiformis TaxID=47236 RepID=A0AAV9WIL5_9PEZI